MADSAALRMRRSRAHKAGDHSLCKRCPDGPPAPAAREGQEIPADDAGKLRWLAGSLAQAYKADPGNALLARELRMTLQVLTGGGKRVADADLEELFAELG